MTGHCELVGGPCCGFWYGTPTEKLEMVLDGKQLNRRLYARYVFHPPLKQYLFAGISLQSSGGCVQEEVVALRHGEMLLGGVVKPLYVWTPVKTLRGG